MLGWVFPVRHMVASNSKSLLNAAGSIFAPHVKTGGRCSHLYVVAMFISLFSFFFPLFINVLVVMASLQLSPWDGVVEAWHVRWLCKELLLLAQKCEKHCWKNCIKYLVVDLWPTGPLLSQANQWPRKVVWLCLVCKSRGWVPFSAVC